MGSTSVVVQRAIIEAKPLARAADFRHLLRVGQTSERECHPPARELGRCPRRRGNSTSSNALAS